MGKAANLLLSIEITADRGSLGAFRQTAAGGLIFPVVFASSGVLGYPEQGHADLVPDETLSDPAFVGGLVGLPVIDDDQTLHRRQVRPSDIANGAAIGTILSARWDPERRAIVGEILISHPRGIEAVRDRGIRGLSLGYTAHRALESGAIDGVVYTRRQVRRSDPTNVTITINPRDTTARIAGDSQEQHTMILSSLVIAIFAGLGVKTEEQTAEQLLDTTGDALVKLATKVADDGEIHVAAIKSRDLAADALRTTIATITTERDEALEAATNPGEVAADAQSTMGAARRLQVAADALGIELADDMTTADAQRALVAAIRGTSGDGKVEALDEAAAEEVAGMTGDALTLTIDTYLAGVKPQERTILSAPGGKPTGDAKPVSIFPRRRA